MWIHPIYSKHVIIRCILKIFKRISHLIPFSTKYGTQIFSSFSVLTPRVDEKRWDNHGEMIDWCCWEKGNEKRKWEFRKKKDRKYRFSLLQHWHTHTQEIKMMMKKKKKSHNYIDIILNWMSTYYHCISSWVEKGDVNWYVKDERETFSHDRIWSDIKWLTLRPSFTNVFKFFFVCWCCWVLGMFSLTEWEEKKIPFPMSMRWKLMP